MTAQMVTDTPPAARLPQSAPCVECGTTGGAIPSRYVNPVRIHGKCRTCHDREYSRGYSGNGDRTVFVPQAGRSVPPANDVPAFNAYLWLDEQGRHATHAVYPGVTGRALRLGDAELEAHAARWLALHPEQARPELSGAVFAFGEAA